jgi:hypothetical protein
MYCGGKEFKNALHRTTVPDPTEVTGKVVPVLN